MPLSYTGRLNLGEINLDLDLKINEGAGLICTTIRVGKGEGGGSLVGTARDSW